MQSRYSADMRLDESVFADEDQRLRIPSFITLCLPLIVPSILYATSAHDNLNLHSISSPPSCLWLPILQAFCLL